MGMMIASHGPVLLCQAQSRSIPYKVLTVGRGMQRVPNRRGCDDRGTINVCRARARDGAVEEVGGYLPPVRRPYFFFHPYPLYMEV